MAEANPDRRPPSGSSAPECGRGEFVALYDELRELARDLLSRQPAGHTLQPTALVHEAFVRISRCYGKSGTDQRQVLFLASKVMRSVLVDHARRRNATKRRRDRQRVPLDQVVAAYEERALDLSALDDALVQLETLDSRLARLVELRFFCGLSVEETSIALAVSDRTVRREWQTAKAWLHRKLTDGKTT